MSKVAIQAETEDDRYDTTTEIVCYECQLRQEDKEAEQLQPVVDGILKSLSFSRKEEIKAWEQEFVPCEHTLCLVQEKTKPVSPSGMVLECQASLHYLIFIHSPTIPELLHCSMCQLDANLWLCLGCGNVGCGRSQFGVVRGNSHALHHADTSLHGVVVKLGSITAEGSADVYCYTCNEERTDPALAEHLAYWGINIAERQKTEQSLMEMQVEQNLKWEFAMTNKDGEELPPVYGPGLTGLKNLGNSCYLSSVVQCLFSIDDFRKRYEQNIEDPPFTPSPAEDFETQMQKLADGIWSGRYSKPPTEMPYPSDVPDQRGLAPAMFKHLVGRGHEEFSTMRQQDAFEFLQHLFKIIGLSRHTDQTPNPMTSFRFALEQRLQCSACKKVRYKVDEQDNVSIPVPARRIEKLGDESGDGKTLYENVTLLECLKSFTSEETVELTCPSCGNEDGFKKRSLFKTLPRHLILNARRFELINWVPTKLEIPVEVSNEPLDLTQFVAPEHPSDEEPLPEDPESNAPSLLNQDILQQLTSMGFPQFMCENAMRATGSTDVESAMNWLLEHIDEAESQGVAGGGNEPPLVDVDVEKVQQLLDMGMSEKQAHAALVATGGDVARALDWIFSHPDQDDSQYPEAVVPSRPTPGLMEIPARYQLHAIVCHKGASVHAG